MNKKTGSTPIPFLAPANNPNAAAWICALQAALPDEQIVAFKDLSEEARAGAELAIVANPDPADLKKMPNLRWVHSVWAGVERLVADLGHSNLKIVRLVDPQLAATMSEAVLAWTLYLHRDMPAYALQQKQGIWQDRPYRRPQSKTVSLLGLGALGEASAQRLLAAGFKVCGWSRQRKSLPGVECYSGAEELNAMLARSDILVCLLPLTAATKALLNAERLSALPRGAALINFARGPIVVDDDLRSALDCGQIDHAVLDVFAVEPLPVDQWQWSHPRLTLLPHCSAVTDKTSASQIVAANIWRYRESGQLPATVDSERGY